MFLLNGQPLAVDTPFTANDIQYPANWLRLSTAEEKSAIGITEVPDPVRADDRFYWNGDINNPKALEDVIETVEGKEYTTKGLKSNFIAQVKATAGSILAQSDWMVIRKAERNVDIPSSVATLPVVPLPINGSNTIPFSGHPAKIGIFINSSGKYL